MRKCGVLLTLILSIFLFNTGEVFGAAAAIGGSNYNWYYINGCDREPYGIIANYHMTGVRTTVQGQLATMRNNGQQRLRVAIYHMRALNSGTVMDSTGGNLSTQNRTNLQNFFSDIKNAGFVEIELGFFPVGVNSPLSWGSWDEGMYQENWNLIYNLHGIIANAGILYRIDLMNEGTPLPSQAILRSYAWRLWADYNYVFGRSDTVGFSIIGNQPDRISQIPVIYGGSENGPYLYDLHFYAGGDGPNYDERGQFILADIRMQSVNVHHDTGWIIGEVFYNDATTASGLLSAMNLTGRTVFYLAQWPLGRSQECLDVTVAPPADFSNYSSYGF